VLLIAAYQATASILLAAINWLWKV